MTEVLEEFPTSHRGRPAKYPWDEWADGKVRRLVQGEHFPCSVASFRALVHKTASSRAARGLPRTEARTGVKGNSIIVQFYDPEPKDD